MSGPKKSKAEGGMMKEKKELISCALYFPSVFRLHPSALLFCG
jgi:hypothetical protein